MIFSKINTKKIFTQTIIHPFIVCLLTTSCTEEIDQNQATNQLASETGPTGIITKKTNDTTNTTSTPEVSEVAEKIDEIDKKETEEIKKIPRLVDSHLYLDEQEFSKSKDNILNLSVGKTYIFTAFGDYIYAPSNVTLTPEIIESTVVNKVSMSKNTTVSISDSSPVECAIGETSIQCIPKDFGPYKIEFKFAEASYIITGNIENPGITSIALYPSLNQFNLDEKTDLSIISNYADGNQIDVTSDSEIWLEKPQSEVLRLKKSTDGIWSVIAIGPGEEVINFKFGEFHDTWKVKVIGPSLMGINIQQPLKKILTEETFKIIALGTYSDGSTRDVSDRVVWEFNNNYLKISDDAVDFNDFYATKAGKTDVKISFGGYTNSLEIDIEANIIVNVFYVNPSPAYIGLGSPFQMQGLGTTDLDEVNITKSVLWSSSDETIFKVDDKGVITPINKGSATLTAKYKQFEDVIVEVNILDPQVAKIKIVPVDLGPEEKITDDWLVDKVVCGDGKDGGSTKNWHAYQLIATFTDGTTDDTFATHLQTTWTTSDVAYIKQIQGDSLIVPNETFHEAPYAYFETFLIENSTITAKHFNQETFQMIETSLEIEPSESKGKSLGIILPDLTDPTKKIEYFGPDENLIPGRPIGSDFNFLLSKVHTCGIEYLISNTEAEWSVETVLSNPNKFKLKGAGQFTTKALVDGSSTIYEDIVDADGNVKASELITIKATMEAEEGMIEGTFDVELRPSEITDIEIFLKDRNLTKKTSLLREGETIELIMETTFTNGNKRNYAQTIDWVNQNDQIHTVGVSFAERLTFTASNSLYFDLTFNPTNILLTQKDNFGSTDITVKYTPPLYEENSKQISFIQTVYTGNMCPDDILWEKDIYLIENSRQLIGNGELIEDEEFNLFEEKLSSSNPELTRGLRSWNKKSCYYLGGLGQSCTDVCSQMNDNITGNIDNISGTFTSVYDADSTLLLGSDSTYTGNNAGVSECSSLASNPTAQLFHKIFTSNDYLNIGTVGNGLGCSKIPSTNTLIRIIGDPTTADASETFIQRVCGCKLVHTP